MSKQEPSTDKTTRQVILNEVQRRGMSLWRLSQDTGVEYDTLYAYLNDGLTIDTSSVERVLRFLELE